MSDICLEIQAARQRGCNRIVLIGEGEPMLHPEVGAIITAARSEGLKSNVITNGTLPIDKYNMLFRNGLNHLQISAHAIGEDLDAIMEHPHAGQRQKELMSWLVEDGHPFRTNTSLQQMNYKKLPNIVSQLIEWESFHIALLGFLPHYEWRDHVSEIAVHPAILRPYLEGAADLLIDSGKLFTIRYHPFCHISPKYWKYIVNARYVLFDPWEWDYGHYKPRFEDVWPYALALGENVAIQGEPCKTCQMRLFCGGWNRFYAEAFAGADLTPISGDYHLTFPADLHTKNEANNLKGYWEGGKLV
jgi:MoaA/NifB/PqqE/SkfB family radical SAM enzyme